MSTTPITTITLTGASGSSYKFQFLETLKPDRDIFGKTIQDEYTDKQIGVPRNQYGYGPFCTFSIKRPIKDDISCVYMWFHKQTGTDGAILYIGETKDLKDRFYKYGHISPGDCRDADHNGNSTNCKMNNVLLNLGEIDLYIYHTKEHEKIEKDLLLNHVTFYNDKDN